MVPSPDRHNYRGETPPSLFPARPSHPPRGLVIRALAVTCAVVASLIAVLPERVHAATAATLHRRADRQRATLWRDTHTLVFFRNHLRLAVTDRGQRAARFARAEIRWTRRELAQTVAALKPKPSLSQSSWLVQAFMCIHSHEGAWNANTGNGYQGGLQFGYSEWQRFGGDFASAAYLASPSEQIQAGIRYYRISGFSPWPNTARMCGLL